MDETNQINGFFLIEIQKPTRVIEWIFGLIIGAGLSYIGVGGAINMIRGEAGQLSGFEIFFWIISLFIGFFLVIRGLIVIFKKSGVYFKGLRTTESGFETGSLTVMRDAIEPKKEWEKSRMGNIQKMSWQSGKQLTGDPLNVVILLKESLSMPNCFYFDRFIIASSNEVIYELRGSRGRNDLLSNDLVVVNNGEFRMLGGRTEVDYHILLPSLKCISDVLLTSTNNITITLNFLAKTVDMTQFGLTAGMIGALLGSGINASERKSLIRKLHDGRKFDKEFVDELMRLADEAGWVIAVEGEDIQL
ncbi:hypothetical protein ACFLXZ_00460 [Chloroflexota bacterium]